MKGSLGIAVCGLGFIGRTHVRAYREADAAGYRNRMVAICDARADTLDLSAKGNLEAPGGALELAPETLRLKDFDELLAQKSVDAISLCTPTPTHVDLAIRVLKAGKHVLVEKPVALHSQDVERLAAQARASSVLCMPAMCMRFWPGWDWLADCVRDGRYGKALSMSFRRLGSRPDWSEFYADSERSGGALFDLHIHDADFVRSLYGEPREVIARGNLDHVSALYRFEQGPAHVLCEGGWDHAPGWDFRMQYTVVFENATADFDLSRDPQLRVTSAGKTRDVELNSITGWDGEIRHFLQAISKGDGKASPTMEDAFGLTRMLEEERRQLSSTD